MSLWSSYEADKAVQGASTKPWAAEGISIDSRTLSKGDLFLALQDKRDGHEFVAAAFRAGAAAAMVSRIPDSAPPGAPYLVVDDVAAALTQLGAAGRSRSRARIVAVTGSVGKTSSKEMLRHAFRMQGKTAAAEQSFNNHLGVPITLAQLPKDADYAVVEIGMNNPGEILPLSKLASPDSAIVTKVAPVHMAAFDSIDGIVREKASIFLGVRERGSAILNSDSKGFGTMRKLAASRGLRISSFGRKSGSDWQMLDSCACGSGTAFTLLHAEQRSRIRLRAVGKHFAENALGVLAAVQSVGADPILAADSLAKWLPPPGRGTRHSIRIGSRENSSFTLVDDAFNASPVSLAAALESLLATEPANGPSGVMGKRIAVLGDMLELGESEHEIHAGIAKLDAISDIDTVHCAGGLMRSFYEALPRKKRGRWFETSEEMVVHASDLAGPGDVILIKGSKGSKIAAVAEAIRALSKIQELETGE